MPKIDKVYTLEITVEQFLRACSSTELQELDLLLGSAMRRNGNKVQLASTKWVGIHIPLELDRQIVKLQEKFEDAGKSKPNKADLCVDLILKGLELAEFDDLVKLQEEIDFGNAEPANK